MGAVRHRDVPAGADVTAEGNGKLHQQGNSEARPSNSQPAASGGDNAKLVKQGALPDLTLQNARAEADDLLRNPHAAAWEKLKAVEVLARSGAESVTLKDKDGTERACRVELETLGKKTLIHLFANDSNGKEHVILRGISNGDGTYGQEQDPRGRKVSYIGSWWSAHMDSVSNISGLEAGVNSGNPKSDSVKSANTESQAEAASSPAKPKTPAAETHAEPERSNAPVAGRLGWTMPNLVAPMSAPELPATTAAAEDPHKQSTARAADSSPPSDGRAAEVQASSDATNDSSPAKHPHHFENIRGAFEALASTRKYSGKHMERLPGGAVYMEAGMDICADGRGGRALDPRNGQNRTALSYRNGSYLDSTTTPYVVVPMHVHKQYGIELGDHVFVKYRDNVVEAIVGDIGPHYKLGEGSIRLARLLGMNRSTPNSAEAQRGVQYIVFPDSGDRTPGDRYHNLIKARALLLDAANREAEQD